MVWDVDLIIYEIEIYVVLFRKKIKLSKYIIYFSMKCILFYKKLEKNIYIIKYICII